MDRSFGPMRNSQLECLVQRYHVSPKLGLTVVKLRRITLHSVNCGAFRMNILHRDPVIKSMFGQVCKVS